MYSNNVFDIFIQNININYSFEPLQRSNEIYTYILGTYDCVKKIYLSEGLKGYYAGTMPSLIANVGKLLRTYVLLYFTKKTIHNSVIP